MTRDLTITHALLSTATSLSPAVLHGATDAAGEQSGSTQRTPPRTDEWSLVNVGPENKRIHVLRLVSQPTRNPFAKLAIELGLASETRMVGRLMFPVRLKPAIGVRLRVDGVHPLGQFSVAPAANKRAVGSIVKLDFDSLCMEHLFEGKALNIFASGASNGKPVQFTVPLAGFANSFDQLMSLQFPQ